VVSGSGSLRESARAGDRGRLPRRHARKLSRALGTVTPLRGQRGHAPQCSCHAPFHRTATKAPLAVGVFASLNQHSESARRFTPIADSVDVSDIARFDAGAMSATGTFAAVAYGIRLMFKAMSVAPRLPKLLGRYESKPSAGDRKVLVAFAKLMDERRVWRHPFHMEVFEACVSSLSLVKDKAEEAITQIENPGAQAVLGALLDDLRAFIDRWHGCSTPRSLRGGWEPPGGGGQRGGDSDLTAFFDDLGALRVRAQLWMSALKEIEPKIKVPKFAA
jgi:hypothetical protein